MDKKVCDDLKAQYDKYVKETKEAMKDAKKKEKKPTATKEKKPAASKEKKPTASKKCAEILSSTIQNKKTCSNYINPSDKKMYCYSKSTNYKAI